ncbi:DUF4105 domain-containing protein [Patescibacteria group bacterium]|nr:DUF4105 domain-containing protein [Patescibacteria group bacterium]
MKKRNFIWVLLLAFAGVMARIFLFLAPKNERNWMSGQKVLPYAKVKGDKVKIFNVRNFEYKGKKVVERYYDKVYDLKKIESVWFSIVPFSLWRGIAHTMISFGFEGGTYVCVSIEARRTTGEKYSPLMGFFRKYELMIVIGDERDVIGLRTNVRKNDVYLYPIKTTRERMRKAFLEIVKRVNTLKEKPEFYNTFLNACTDNLAEMVNKIVPGRVPLSLKVFFPGYSDRLAYKIGLIDDEGEFDDLKAKYYITKKAQKAGIVKDFSEKIRAGV